MFNFKKDVANISGWLTEKEGNYLYQIAKELPEDGIIVEIGSWKGRSTVCFGLGVKNGAGATVCAIDPHTGSAEHHKRFGKIDTYKDFIQNLKNKGIEKFVIPIKKTSEEAVKDFQGKADFILVDGAHEYKYVNLDYKLWFSKLKIGRIIGFHDCWHKPGVHYLTTKILFTSKEVRKPRLIDSLTTMEKVESNTFADRLENIIFVFYRLFFGWKGTIKIDWFGTVH